MMSNLRARCSHGALSALPNLFRGQRLNGDRAPSLQRLSTWLLFCLLVTWSASAHALTLETAFARALEKNPAILEAKARLEEAAGRRLILRASALPNAAMMIPAGVQGGKRAGEKPVQPYAFAQGGFVQPVFNAAIPASYRRGNIEVLLAQQRLNVAVVEQLDAVRVAFYTAAYNNSLRVVGEEQRARLEENFRTQTDRYAAGQSDRLAVATARLLEQELKPRLEEFQRAYGGALLTLAQATGEDLGPHARLPTTEGDLEFTDADLDVDRETNLALRIEPIYSLRVCSCVRPMKINGSSKQATIQRSTRPWKAATFRLPVSAREAKARRVVPMTLSPPKPASVGCLPGA